MTKNSNLKVAIIITAAGSSTRIGGGIKKEYLPLNNGTVLSNCANVFLKACSGFSISDFIITCPAGGKDNCLKALPDFDYLKLGDIFNITEGADTRQKSVFNALKAVKNNPDIVLIHDGARPFVTEEVIIKGLEGALECGAAVPGITPVDTQKEIDASGFIVRHLQRSLLTAVQTPQCFKFKELLQAHNKAIADGKEYTDDTEIWGVYCGQVKVTQGDVNNIKITYPGDLEKLK